VVERAGLERVGHEVAHDVLDAGAIVLAPGHGDARRVTVDALDVRDDAAQVARQHADAAAHVEAAPRAVRDGGEHHTVVVEVVVPPRWARPHASMISPPPPASRRQKGS
jgi:hypothetical protein